MTSAVTRHDGAPGGPHFGPVKGAKNEDIINLVNADNGLQEKVVLLGNTFLGIKNVTWIKTARVMLAVAAVGGLATMAAGFGITPHHSGLGHDLAIAGGVIFAGAILMLYFQPNPEDKRRQEILEAMHKPRVAHEHNKPATYQGHTASSVTTRRSLEPTAPPRQTPEEEVAQAEARAFNSLYNPVET
jgi:hypothetical protein